MTKDLTEHSDALSKLQTWAAHQVQFSTQHIQNLLVITDLLSCMSNSQIDAIANGAPISPKNGQGVIDRSHPFWIAMKAFMGKLSNLQPEQIHIASGNVDRKNSIGLLPRVTDHSDGLVRIPLVRMRKPQIDISKTNTAKWALPAGGFMLNDGVMPQQCINQHWLNKMHSDVPVDVGPFPEVRLVQKEPYGVNNEGYTDNNGNVIGGDIVGIVMRQVFDMSHTRMDQMVQSVVNGTKDTDNPMELQFFTRDEFITLVTPPEESDENHEALHTLDFNEIKFLLAAYHMEV
ncbi:MAG: hypothetical protein OXR68_01770 [Alphaproteobacteria bacterium]|nr:hypothetical protein [Alphaproteobacteria bacterium]MDD9919339.1 hypothetical protein [Alphaproteobacteria bacterium]